MFFSDYTLDPTTINGTKYRTAKFNVVTTSAEGFKLLSAVSPSLGVVADPYNKYNTRGDAYLYGCRL